MAERIAATGERTFVKPARHYFTLEELREHIGAEYVEAIPLPDGYTMWMDEEAKLKTPVPPRNSEATKLLERAGGIPWDFVVGTVLVTTPEEVETGC